MTKIGCIVTTYRDNSRLRQTLINACLWADRIAVFDKANDHKSAKEICSDFSKAIRIEIPYSDAGQEQRRYYSGLIDEICPDFPEWVIGLTAGDVLTQGLADEILKEVELSGHMFDVGLLLTKTYSFGVNNERGPWRSLHTARMHNRKRTTPTEGAHTLIAEDARVKKIGSIPSNYVLHQTHASGAEFIQRHAVYAKEETLKKQHCSKGSLVKAFVRLLISWALKSKADRQYIAFLCYQSMRLLMLEDENKEPLITSSYQRNRQRINCGWDKVGAGQG